MGDRNQGGSGSESECEGRFSNQSGAVATQEVIHGGRGGGTCEFVVLSDALQLQTRPVDVGGQSGIFVYHIEGDVESECMSVLEMVNTGGTDWRQLSEQEAETLPELVRDELKTQNLVQATVVVDDFTEFLVVLCLGWGFRDQNSADVLAAMLRCSDRRGFTRAVYYYLSMFASETYANPDALARLKDIQSSTIHSELRKAETEWGEQLVGVGGSQ